MGQEIQGVSTPLIVQTKTMVEKIRIIRLKNGEYNLLRSFTESSLKGKYQWRVGYEYPEAFVWRKPNKWELKVFKNAVEAEALELPVRGVFKVTNIMPFAVLSSVLNRGEVDFVALSNGEMGMLYTGRVALVFTKDAPIAFAPITPIPFSRLISAYEVINTLQHYVTF